MHYFSQCIHTYIWLDQKASSQLTVFPLTSEWHILVSHIRLTMYIYVLMLRRKKMLNTKVMIRTPLSCNIESVCVWGDRCHGAFLGWNRAIWKHIIIIKKRENNSKLPHVQNSSCIKIFREIWQTYKNLWQHKWRNWGVMLETPEIIWPELFKMQFKKRKKRVGKKCCSCHAVTFHFPFYQSIVRSLDSMNRTQGN